jgi:hypothetical protein
LGSTIPLRDQPPEFGTLRMTSRRYLIERLQQETTPKGPVGRPRIHKNRSECDRAYKQRRKQRKAEGEKIREENHVLSIGEVKAIHATARPPDTGARVPSLKGQLVDAERWNVDGEADVAPILALLDQG